MGASPEPHPHTLGLSWCRMSELWGPWLGWELAPCQPPEINLSSLCTRAVSRVAVTPWGREKRGSCQDWQPAGAGRGLWRRPHQPRTETLTHGRVGLAFLSEKNLRRSQPAPGFPPQSAGAEVLGGPSLCVNPHPPSHPTPLARSDLNPGGAQDVGQITSW